jgi:Putative addiction module component
MRCRTPAGRRMLETMNISVEKIAEMALALSSDARALLADRLAESLDPLTDESVKSAWIGEANARMREVRAGEVKAIPRDAAVLRVRDRLK